MPNLYSFFKFFTLGDSPPGHRLQHVYCQVIIIRILPLASKKYYFKKFGKIQFSRIFSIILQRVNSFNAYAVASGLQGRPERPLEIGRIFVEIWCYLPDVSTFGEDVEIQEIFSKKF